MLQNSYLVDYLLQNMDVLESEYFLFSLFVTCSVSNKREALDEVDVEKRMKMQ